VCVILSRVEARVERAVAVVVLATIHMLFLLYLHFAYHTIVEGENYRIHYETLSSGIVYSTIKI
jgi:hypothetical protein